MGTPDGVIKARTFRRKGSLEERWDKTLIMSVKGVPLEPVLGGGGVELTSRLTIPTPDVVGQAPEPAARAFRSRAWALYKPW